MIVDLLVQFCFEPSKCGTDLTLEEWRKSCRNARATLVLDLRLRDVFFLFFFKQTLLGSLVMSSDFFELWVGVGACNRTELWTAGWELVRGEQRCKSRGHVRKSKRTSGSPGLISVVL